MYGLSLNKQYSDLETILLCLLKNIKEFRNCKKLVICVKFNVEQTGELKLIDKSFVCLWQANILIR